MKKLFLLFCALLPLQMSFLSAAVAEQIAGEEAARQLLIDKVAEEEGWCDQPVPRPALGEAAIYWIRDADGHCRKSVLIVGPAK